MGVEVERFDVDAQPTAGRPRVMELRDKKAGHLSLHIQREDGSLWMFAVGPAGGARGTLSFPRRMADEVLAWTQAPESYLSSGHYMTIREHAKLAGHWRLIVGKWGWERDWRMTLDDATREELLGALRLWVEAVARLG